MATGYTWDDGARGHNATITFYELSKDPNTNTSVIQMGFQYDTIAGIGNFDGYSVDGYFKVTATPDGTGINTYWQDPTGWNSSLTNKYLGYTTGGPYVMYAANSSHRITVHHAADGTGTATSAGKFVATTQTTSADGYYTPNLVAKTYSITLTPFASPNTPGAPTLSRSSSTPGTISVTSKTLTSAGGSLVPTNGANITRYDYDYSTDNVTWNNATNGIDMGSDGIVDITGLTVTQGYYVRTRAVSYEGTTSAANTKVTWGYGPWSASTFIAGVPSTVAKPTISNVVTTSLTLSWTAPANNGATISSYTVQESTDGGVTWTDRYTGITTTSKDVTGLTIAATYKFRILAVNSTGTSVAGGSTTWSDDQFISAYGYRFTSPTAKTAISSAARYTGNANDSVTVGGTVYTKWAMIQNVKKFKSGSGFTPLEQ